MEDNQIQVLIKGNSTIKNMRIGQRKIIDDRLMYTHNYDKQNYPLSIMPM